MITPWTVYWIGILDGLNEVVKAVAFFSGAFALIVIAMIMLLIFTDDMPDLDNTKRKILIRGTSLCACIFLISVTVAAFLPSTKLAASMYLIPAVVNNEDMQQISGNALKGLKKMTEQWLLEITEEEMRGKEIQGKEKKENHKSEL